MKQGIPLWRVFIYVAMSYVTGIYLGALTIPEVTCVSVDSEIYCGKVIK